MSPRKTSCIWKKAEFIVLYKKNTCYQGTNVGVLDAAGVLFIAVASLIGCCCSINIPRFAERGKTILTTECSCVVEPLHRAYKHREMHQWDVNQGCALVETQRVKYRQETVQ